MRPELTRRRARCAHLPRQVLRGAAAVALFWVAMWAHAGESQDAGRLLKQADGIKTTDRAGFVAILDSLEARRARLSGAQKDYLRYLKAWKAVVEGDDRSAVADLKDIIEHSGEITLQFRARSTLMNLQEITGHYADAYSELNRVVEQLPRVSDKSAREQAMLAAAQLYRAVGQTDLSLGLARKVIDENGSGRGICRGGQQKLAALYESGRLQKVGAEVQEVTDACEELGEALYANEIRTHTAKLYIEQGRLDEAIELLKGHREETVRTQYSRLISAFDSLLAEAYRRKGYAALAQTSAYDSLQYAVKGPVAETLARANQVLYELAKQRGDYKAALAFHEQYAAAEQGRTDETNARQLAYDKVTHEVIASKLQIAALTKQNEVLRLQKALDLEQLKNSRLNAVLLITILLLIGLWAYRIKRSQLHFMSLSRRDGLTGIWNRHHFISQAEIALEQARKSQQELCIILCDLDHFKAINDRHGHATGDFVLQEAVSRCKVHLHAHEVFGRFGGEEFSILLPATRPDAARQRAEQLRLAVNAVSASFGLGELKVSASFGIASTSFSGYELRQLLAHADAALYQAKGAGRNRVVLYEPGAIAEKAVSLVLPRTAAGN